MYRLQNQCKLCCKVLKRRQLHRENAKLIGALAPAYKPNEIEGTSNFDYFTPPASPEQPPFNIILPPPNITGTLHLGHALTACIQDVLVKWHKMNCSSTMWVPGLDHAGIATQVVVEKKLMKERGVTRHQLGRAAFEREVWQWKQDKASTIVAQLKRLNLSIDWDKEVFTMDQARSEAVVEAFIKLFEQGLIYRADHLVNWSCTLQSAISDIEVDHVEVDGATDFLVPGYEQPVKFGTLVKFAYKLADCNEEIVVATTRPETILGDVAVAVNPKDNRYAHLIGRRLQHPFRNDVIPVIADDFVDLQFGTGAVKITPAHDPTDFECGKRHKLTPLSVIDENGLITDLGGCFKGQKRFIVRETIVDYLTSKGLFRGSENHKMAVPICSRSQDVVESIIRPQWFLDCAKMADKALLDVREGRLKIEPDNFRKVWFQWLENIRPWCISRQLWWGHRIPIYFCQGNNKDINCVAARDLEEAKMKASKVLNCDLSSVIKCVQDEDVLDTWFSSGLQPMSVFGWPENREFFKNYPLSLMETGHDIIFFWVARMVMLGTHLTGQLPFDHILLHGIICDAHGRKMSKSLGNVVAPEDVLDGASLEELKEGLKQSILTEDELQKAIISQQKMFPKGIPACGADALRFTLLSHNVKSHLINFDISECHTNQLFGNKIWQATKFTLLWLDKVREVQNVNDFVQFEDKVCEFVPMDRWILSRLAHMVQSVSEALEHNDFYLATSALKQFLYYEFCDIYLESVKTDLKDTPEAPVSKQHCWTLLTCLDVSLRALAPFMPALSQHLHRHLPLLWHVGADRSFPKVNLDLKDPPLEQEVTEINEIITGIRRLKKMFNVTYKYKPEVFLYASNADSVQRFFQVIKDLSNLYTLRVLGVDAPKPDRKGLVKDRLGINRVYLVVPDELIKNLEVDGVKMERKKEKLLKEMEKLEQDSGVQEIRLKKLAQITEKIARIDYIQRLTK